MMRSFRLRLTLLSVLLSGIALAAFGTGAAWRILSLRLQRLDNDVRAYAEREASRRRDPAGWQRMEATVESEMGVRNGQELAILVLDSASQTVYRSPHWPAGIDAQDLPWPRLPVVSRPALHSPPPLRPAPEAPPGPPPVSTLIARMAGGQQWRIGLATSEGARIAVGVQRAAIRDDMRSIRNAFLVSLPLSLIPIAIGGWVFASRALRPVRTLAAAARRVSAEGLDQRIAVRGEDLEFVELIDVFNGMLERLERSFKQAHRFSSDAAHELKTPLAILQGQLERTLHAAEDGSPLQVELNSILDEVRRLSTISRKLLLLAQADAGRLRVAREPFALSNALCELLEDAHMLAPGLQVIAEVQPDLSVPADGDLLMQILHNLISNAIKYNVEGGWIRVMTRPGAKQIEVRVANSSSGIPAAEREKIFERFYRADAARSRHVEGFGLGLSVSREIARAHGGDLILSATTDNSTQFSLVLPCEVAQVSPTAPPQIY